MLGRLRLISGLVLFTFVLAHLLNHSLGIISLKAMNDGLKYSIEPWRTLPGTILLTWALSTHVVLAGWSLYKRRSFRMPMWEVAQIVLGILVPILIASHVLATRGLYEVHGLEEGYAFQLYAQWQATPMRGIMAVAALLAVWVHACIGWHYWLRLKPWYAKFRIAAFSFAIVVPVLALAGIVSGGFRVLRLSRSEKWVERLWKNIEPLPETLLDFVTTNEKIILAGIAIFIVFILGRHSFRRFLDARPSSDKLNYRNADLSVSVQLNLRSGTTVLEQIRNAGIPHASVCGGKGRCSTCRVRIDAGKSDLAEPNLQESKILERISAAPNVRLACQLVPTRTVEVTALLNPDAIARDGLARPGSHDGEEQDIAVMFADIRAFTRLSEAKLPYDTAFLLNRYFAAMGQAIEKSGGHLDKFIGDGVMALFGIDKSVEDGREEAISAAYAMAVALEELNKSLANDLPEPLKIGIGIHAGTAIVGNMGYNETASLTAIGDVVNTASRLEGMTKELDVQLIISREVARNSNVNFEAFPSHQVKVRGREEVLSVYAVKSALALGK